MTGFFNLPKWMQAAAGLLVLVALIGIILLKPPAIVLLVLVGGIVFVVLLILVYVFLLKRAQKKRSAPFEQDLRESGSAVPQGVSDVADRARLDEMRKKFDLGVATFRDHGKDIYTLPWYMMIGEPGSGKTEAIRHCDVGFPPGLQDELQGTGGTINMDWWFTNHAVLLDTAGRLTFGSVDGADTAEWREFLRLMRKHRPNCPINGMVLAIPIDSLIQDDAETIDTKGGLIARQLDLVQRTLGVRFPVYIIVTKTDKLVGFRQFFGDVRDPDLQGQMFGWSNPDDLDAPFEPEYLNEYLLEVDDRVRERRLGLLLDPVNTEDPAASRTAQVDELFAFPEAIQRVIPRLSRYLDRIFVSGEWSSRPLFLRGIYFTSSMQHGQALDAELAEALGVEPDQLEDSPWTEDKAYFLRDVCLEKLFRERGLVTNATNTRSLQRKRRVLLLAAGLASALALFILVVYSVWDYRNKIDGPREFWAGAANTYGEEMPRGNWRIVTQDGSDFHYRYRGGREFESGESLLSLLAEARANARTIKVPWMFRAASVVVSAGDLRTACAALFEDGVLIPLVEATLLRLDVKRSDLVWNEKATAALAEILDLHAHAQGDGPRESSVRAFDLAALLDFALTNEKDLARDKSEDLEELQEIFEWLYGEDEVGFDFPPAALADIRTSDSIRGLRLAAAIDGFRAFAMAKATGEGEGAEELNAVKQAVFAFDDAERAVIDAVDPTGLSMGPWVSEPLWDDLEQRSNDLASDLGKWTDSGEDSFDPLEFPKALSDIKRDAESDIRGLVLQLLTASRLGEEITELPAQGETPIEDQLLDALREAKQAMSNDATLNDQMRVEDLVMKSFGPVSKSDSTRCFEARVAAFDAARSLATDPSPAFGDPKETLESIDATLRSGKDLEGAAGARFETACRVSRTIAIGRLLRMISAADLHATVAKAAGEPETLEPVVPLSTRKVDPGYDPIIGGAVFADVAAARIVIEAERAGVPGLRDAFAETSPVQTTLAEYEEAYTEHWTDQLRKDVVPKTTWGTDDALHWKRFKTAMREAGADEIIAAMDALAVSVKTALEHTTKAGMIEDLQAFLGSEADEDLIRDVYANWRSLPDNTQGTREEWSVGLSSGFEERYFLPATVGGFWEEFPMKCAAILERSSLGAAIAAQEYVAEEARFPFAEPDNQHDQLPRESLKDFESKIAAIRLRTGQGAVDSLPTSVAGLVTKILSPELSRETGERLDGMQPMLKALLPLPSSGSFTAELSIAPPKPNEDAVVGFWRVLEVKQGDVSSGEMNARGADGEVARLEFPGEPIRFMFRQRGGEAPDGRIKVRDRKSVRSGTTPAEFSGPWAVLLMLYDFEATTSDGGDTWDFAVRVDDPETSGVTRVLNLSLKFDRKALPFDEDHYLDVAKSTRAR